jgi:hypothetical protein
MSIGTSEPLTPCDSSRTGAIVLYSVHLYSCIILHVFYSYYLIIAAVRDAGGNTFVELLLDVAQLQRLNEGEHEV